MKFTLPKIEWRSPEILLLLMAGAVPLSFATWLALVNNFAIERAAFTGRESSQHIVTWVVAVHRTTSG